MPYPALPTQLSHIIIRRRSLLRWAGLAVGAALLPSGLSTFKTAMAAAQGKSNALKVTSFPAPTGVSKVVLVHSDDRVSGTRRAIELLQPTGIAGKKIFLKPNYNTADPAPGSTDSQLLEALIQELQNAKAGQITVGDRSGMADTRQVMQQKGLFQLADRYGLKTVVLDELEANQWQYFSPEGIHWKEGFAFAKPALEADAIVTTGCLKSHGGARYTLALKNTIGLVAKQVPGDRFNYMMQDLHVSEHMQWMIAEANAVYQPALVLMDGVDVFTNGGPDKGEKVAANVILAGSDRVAMDVVSLALLRSLGTNAEISQGSIWKLGQIQRAISLGLGAAQPEQIELVAADGASQKIIDRIRPYMKV
jgi:uncharacterized protein (DUF362 family)